MLTHQLQPISGMGPMADNIVRRMHYRLLGRFDTVWVVDVPEGGYAGFLSHPHVMPENSAYLGLLSSCTAMPSAAPEPGSVLVVLSGPEPQRSVLSHILKEQLHSYRGMVNFVEGAPVTDSGMLPAHATHYGRLSPDELMPLLGSAEYIFCRSGYSTVMDLLAMGKRAILIPTPGQTEQTYLATHLQQYGFVTMRQDRPDISAAIAACSGCGASTSATNGADFSSFVPIVAKWTEGL
jgi:predicted glycosyltransferase